LWLKGLPLRLGWDGGKSRPNFDLFLRFGALGLLAVEHGQGVLIGDKAQAEVVIEFLSAP
jgi:hypothetical protein